MDRSATNASAHTFFIDRIEMVKLGGQGRRVCIMAYTRSWSLGPYSMTPEDKTYFFAFVIIRSMHMLLVEVVLVGAEMSWDNCSWFMQSVSLIAFAFWLELLRSQFRSPRIYN